jgi:DNA-binding NtrC family response regulator
MNAPENLMNSILLVEDDSALRMMLRGALEAQHYLVVEADNRNAALEILRRKAPVGVILLDLGLPPCPYSPDEGLALVKIVAEKFSGIKVIVLTGQEQEGTALAAIREGAFDFLAKPTSTVDVLQAVRRAFLFYNKEQEMAGEGVSRLQYNFRVGEGGLKGAREEVEEKIVRQVLLETGFNVNRTAARLGLKRESIYYFMKKFGIQRQND